MKMKNYKKLMKMVQFIKGKNNLVKDMDKEYLVMLTVVIMMGNGFRVEWKV